MTFAKLRGPGDLRAGERIGGLDKFSQQIRARRADLQLTQGELATLAGISRGTIKTTERGEVGVTVTPGTLVGIHCALGWAPRFPEDLSTGFDPIELLSANTMRPIAAALLQLMVDRSPDGSQRLVLDLQALMDGLASDPPTLPDSFEYLLRVSKRYCRIWSLTAFTESFRSGTGSRSCRATWALTRSSAG